MIHTNRVVTVGEQESIIDRPIVLYRGDREVEIEFTLVGNEFMFSEEGNVIKSVNASHGQLVLNTPSGEHMFSELAECHEGKVVFVVTKEMIDEFIEMGFYSFQIRLYDSAEMKSRVTIPPVMNGFDIRNPIAAEDDTNVVDQGIVDYARIYKDQSNEELPTFTWDGEYVKTEWAHHDVITENKMNKIEDALYSINANIKESDVVMLNALDNVKKDADKYVQEHMAEVEADVEEFERNLNTGVEKFKIDTNAAMTAHKNEVSEVVDGFSDEIESINSQLADIKNKNEINVKDFGAIGGVENNINDTEAFLQCFEYANNNHKNIIIPEGEYYINNTLVSNGTYMIKGHNAKIICSGDMLDSFLIINKSIDDLNKMTNIYDSGIDCLCLEGNGNCDYTLYIEQGKAITLNRLVCRGGKKYSCLMGSDKGQIWELNVRQCEFNANIPGGNQGEYAFYMLQNLSDNLISDSYFINGSKGWARFCSSGTNINNIHGYSYPEDLAPEIGFHVYSTSTYFGYVICDTPGRIGMLIEGNGCVINNLDASKYAHSADEYIACSVKGNNVTIINLSPGSNFEGDATKVTGVLLDTESNAGIVDFKVLSFYNHSEINHDIRVTGKIPYRFTYDENSLAANTIKIGNYVLHNNHTYSCAAGTIKTINFKNEFSNTLYNVNLYEITGKSIPKYTITNKTTGFDITFLEAVTEYLNIRAIVTMC